MGVNYKITIPKPCHEDWDKMTPDETGRFCTSCAKSVVDFSDMKATEIQEYFIKNKGQKVCGRFQTEQLDSIIIQIPSDILFSQVQFHKIFMLALLVSMGTTLFSCQNSNGDKQNIDKVEVIDSIENQTMGESMPEKDTLKKSVTMMTSGMVITPNLKQKMDSISNLKRNTVPHLTGDVAVSPYTKNPPPPPLKKEFYAASEVEIMPTFPGGIAKFYDYITSNLKVPEDSKDITARMIFSFIVNVDGSLSDIKLLRGVNKDLDAEAMRVLKESPKWIAGEQNGEKVRVSYAIPIKITATE